MAIGGLIMGGSGSGRWERTKSKATVEDCVRLDIWDFLRGNLLCPGEAGTVNWWNTFSGQLKGSVGFCFRHGFSGEQSVDLSFRFGDSAAIVQRVPIVFNRKSDGRLAKWFVCPIIRDGQLCGRRVRKLYARGPLFGCRHCQVLTYQSCQEAHKEERLRDRLQRKYA